MDYRLESMHSSDFERLVCKLCENKLGIGTVRFTDGPDGGRDGRFTGTANSFPSIRSPWTGRFIIQSKHTNILNSSCSDNSFHGNESSLINKEIKKLDKLKKKGELIDCYLVFTNRKESGAREDIIGYLKNATLIDNVDILGKETISEWLLADRETVKLFGLNRFAMPFEFYEDDIKEVITIFHDSLKRTNPNENLVVDRPSIEVKNRINNLDQSYFENIIETDLDRYHDRILSFLHDPKNEKHAIYYEETTLELKRVIETNKEQFDNFKHVFAFLTQYLYEKDPRKLRKYRNTIPAFFHFMYYRCDIGQEK